MNKVLLTGRVANGKFKEYEGAKAYVLKFTLATNEMGENSEFVDVVIFQNTAKNFKKYVKKGDMVEVSGSLKLNSYLDANEEKQYRLEVVGHSVLYAVRAKTNRRKKVYENELENKTEESSEEESEQKLSKSFSWTDQDDKKLQNDFEKATDLESEEDEKEEVADDSESLFNW